MSLELGHLSTQASVSRHRFTAIGRRTSVVAVVFAVAFGRGSALPAYAVLAELLDETDTFKHVGDVVYTTLTQCATKTTLNNKLDIIVGAFCIYCRCLAKGLLSSIPMSYTRR